MNSRQLALLVGVSLAILLGAVWIGATRNPQLTTNAALYPALKGQLQKLDRVRIYKAGDQLGVELTHNELGWHVKQRNDFPADTNKVNALLLNLESTHINEQKTSNPENYAALNVQDLTASGATGTRIEIDGVEPPIKLLVGKQELASRSTYVRRAGEAPSWSVTPQIEAAAEISPWLQHDALNIGADRVQEVIVELAGSARYSSVKVKRADANFDVTGIPKGREVNSVSAGNVAAQSLVNLDLEDVRPATELTNEKSAAHASVHTFDGLVVNVDGYVKDDKRWLIVKAEFDDALAKRFYAAATPQKGNEKEATTADPSMTSLETKGRDEAAAINKKLQPWAIAVASYKYDSLFKPIEQLLKKKS